MAVALAARALGRPCEVFFPSIAPTIKRERLHSLGAKVIVVDDVFAEALHCQSTRLASLVPDLISVLGTQCSYRPYDESVYMCYIFGFGQPHFHIYIHPGAR